MTSSGRWLSRAQVLPGRFQYRAFTRGGAKRIDSQMGLKWQDVEVRELRYFWSYYLWLLEFHWVVLGIILQVHVCWGLNRNSHYYTIGDGHQPIVGIYTPIRRIQWDDHPQYKESVAILAQAKPSTWSVSWTCRAAETCLAHQLQRKLTWPSPTRQWPSLRERGQQTMVTCRRRSDRHPPHLHQQRTFQRCSHALVMCQWAHPGAQGPFLASAKSPLGGWKRPPTRWLGETNP